MDKDKLLHIYLADHLAGASVGQELAKRCLASNEDNALGEHLRQVLAPAIEGDKRTLESIMDELHAPRRRWKQTAARLAEKGGRLKLNGQLKGYSPLSRLLEVEGLCLGIEGKLSLWRALQQVSSSSGRLQRFDLEALIESAKEQREDMERHRLAAAEEALA